MQGIGWATNMHRPILVSSAVGRGVVAGRGLDWNFVCADFGTMPSELSSLPVVEGWGDGGPRGMGGHTSRPLLLPGQVRGVPRG